MTRFFLVFCGLTGLSACSQAPSPEAIAAATHRASFTIEGMTCASCSVTVRTAVRRLEGVGTIEVDASAGHAEVTYDAHRINAAVIAKAITATGYQATVTSEAGI